MSSRADEFTAVADDADVIFDLLRVHDTIEVNCRIEVIGDCAMQRAFDIAAVILQGRPTYKFGMEKETNRGTFTVGPFEIRWED